MLEERLRDDVVQELSSFGGRLLLHSETSDGSVIPVWEEVFGQDVCVLKDVMSSHKHLKGGVEFVDIIPKNPSGTWLVHPLWKTRSLPCHAGKLLRRLLREKAKSLRKAKM